METLTEGRTNAGRDQQSNAMIDRLEPVGIFWSGVFFGYILASIAIAADTRRNRKRLDSLAAGDDDGHKE